MEGLGSVWSGLEPRRRLIVGAAVVVVVLAVLFVGRSTPTRQMALLYAGLDAAAAGEVVTALDTRGEVYEVRGSGIYVESARRDLLRMTLAGEGLPSGGAQGYELLDSLSGFGTTSQMFDAAYWRAKEGELARTIQSSPGVRAVRVHVSVPANRGFQREGQPAAAVTVTSAGGGLSAAQAKAFRHLVASAVTGLAPDDVAVIDESGLVAAADDSSAPAAQGERERLMRERLQRLLEARVGHGNAVVELNIETETETEQIRERQFDPEGRVAIAEDVSERSESASGGTGAVTVASNLPDGDAAGGGSESQASETRQLTNYEVSQVEREVLRAPGAVRRITVAVLINDPVEVDSGVETATPRSEEELAVLRDLVASAVGFDEARGDVITLRSMPFEPPAVAGTEALDVAAPEPPLDVMWLVQLAVMAVVALVLGLFVIRPILTGARPAALPERGPPPALTMEPSARGEPGLPALRETQAGEVAMSQLPTFDMAEFDRAPPQEDLSTLDPVSRLRRLMDERQDETLQILQSWMEESEPENV
ncbi:flagellar basal-body MS-ring/collar protein FliF [Oceanicola granulosus]|uniref:flagellar basal-body MS-ring/collar protein FliF n=1 Tax=Oceanicola granulosus TaxID=252302 RepID=UPI0005912DE8|nr:flagellar basal-body MS-ring/collar protein FliF [Oceanicola granulosus]